MNKKLAGVTDPFVGQTQTLGMVADNIRLQSTLGRVELIARDRYAGLERKRGKCGGRTCIQGTRIEPVHVLQAFKLGSSIEEICTYFSTRQLTRAEVEAALRWAMRYAPRHRIR